jgi:hypothetical protein
MTPRADFDYRALGKQLRPVLDRDGRGWRALATEIGVTPSDQSRVCAGQATAAHKVIAVCDWLDCSLRSFYRAPGGIVPAKVLHGKRTETARARA